MSDNTPNPIFTSPSDELHEEMMKLRKMIEMNLIVPPYILEGKYTKKKHIEKEDKSIESRFDILDL